MIIAIKHHLNTPIPIRHHNTLREKKLPRKLRSILPEPARNIIGMVADIYQRVVFQYLLARRKDDMGLAVSAIHQDKERRNSMAKTKVFISFDYDHDKVLKEFLAGQAKNEESPFDITDFSVKEELSGNWKEKVRERIKKVEQVIVICGEHTDTASGVNAEVSIAQEEGTPYFLLYGKSDKDCKKPKNAKSTDKIYNWTWPNLKSLISGAR